MLCSYDISADPFIDIPLAMMAATARLLRKFSTFSAEDACFQVYSHLLLALFDGAM